MKRPTDGQSIMRIIDNIRNRLPEITLRTTFIVGFPTETETEYKQLSDFIKLYKFDKVGVFKYSREEGTLAATLTPQISMKTKQRRYKEIMELQKPSQKRNERFKRKILKVLVEGYDRKNRLYIGRSENDAPFVDGLIKVTNSDCVVGQIYPVRILETYEYDLLGEVLNEN